MEGKSKFLFKIYVNMKWWTVNWFLKGKQLNTFHYLMQYQCIVLGLYIFFCSRSGVHMLDWKTCLWGTEPVSFLSRMMAGDSHCVCSCVLFEKITGVTSSSSFTSGIWTDFFWLFHWFHTNQDCIWTLYKLQISEFCLKTHPQML